MRVLGLLMLLLCSSALAQPINEAKTPQSRFFNSTSTPPASQCTPNNITNFPQCDLSNQPIYISLQTSGTAGQRPSSGYAFDYNLSTLGAYRTAFDGWNQDTADNGGRTGILNIWAKTDNVSTNGGDATSFMCFPSVFATKSSATSFLASTEAGCLGGQLLAFAAGTYLEGVGDLNFKDNGNDIAVAGVVLNFNRANNTGNINSNWMGYLIQNQGTAPADAMERLVGPTKQTFDAADQTFPNQSITGINLGSGGSGYSVNDILIISTAGGCSGTVDQLPHIKVLAVTGGVIQSTQGVGWGIERAGDCASPPANGATSFTGGTGSGASFNLTWSGTSNPLIAAAANSCWYGNSTTDHSVWNTHYPSTVVLGTSFICYASSINAWNVVAGNTSALQIGQGQSIVNNLLQPVAGITATGGVIQLNTSSNFAVNIGSGTSTSTVSIGNTANKINLGAPLNLTTAGALSANSWTVNGLALSGSAQTLTDSTGTGTITSEAAAALPVYTIAATNASVTITNLDELYLPIPAAGTNVTATNLYSLHTAGAIKVIGQVTGFGGANISGAAIQLNPSSNFNTTINSGTSTGSIQIGNSGTTGVTSLLGISTGTNADFLCLSSGGVVLLQASACTISSMRFKNHVSPWTGDALSELDHLEVDSYQMNDDHNRDPNATLPQIGLIAENVAKVEPKCAIYEPDLKTPKSYRPECITALLVSASQEYHRKSRHQFELIYALLVLVALLAAHGGHLHLKVRRLAT